MSQVCKSAWTIGTQTAPVLLQFSLVQTWRNHAASPTRFRVQIDALEAERGTQPSAAMRLPGSTRDIPTASVLALTGRRFVSSGAPAAPLPPPDVRSLATVDTRSNEQSCKRARRGCNSPDVRIKEEPHAGLAVYAGPNAVTMGHIADAVAGFAPTALTPSEVVAFAQAAKFCNLDDALMALPAYVEPAIRVIAIDNVRSLRTLCVYDGWPA